MTVKSGALADRSNSEPGKAYDQIMGNSRYDFIIIQNSPFLGLFKSVLNKDILSLLKALRKDNKDAKIILADCYIGGMHFVKYDKDDIISRYPEIDLVAMYESEISVLKCILCNKDPPPEKDKGLEPKDVYARDPGPENIEFIEELDSLPFPYHDSAAMKNYLNLLEDVSNKGYSHFFRMDKHTMPVSTSRGCHYDCSFCTSRTFGRYLRMNSLEYMKKISSKAERHGNQENHHHG